MNGWTLTTVWTINGKLVVAESVEAAIALYRKFAPETEIDNISRVYGSMKVESSAIIEETFKEVG